MKKKAQLREKPRALRRPPPPQSEAELFPEELDSGETLQEAESEIGVSEWIDPDTGAPAEDNVPRIEDH